MTNPYKIETKTESIAPKIRKEEQWQGYPNPVWHKKDKKKVTILYSMIERRKSFFIRAYLIRNGYNFIDMGDHIKEDVRWGKEYGNRMECNPMYFTSGSFIRHLFKLHNELGLSKEEVVEKYIFMSGGGQCGPCRYGMYPQEYLKVANDAGFKGFRLMVFSSELNDSMLDKDCAFQFNLDFRINMLISFVLADFMHIAECALRPYAVDKEQALNVITECENILLEAFSSHFYMIKLPIALRKVSRMLANVPKKSVKLPLIYMTGEVFANLAHNEGNYNMRRFIMDEGCEVIPGSFTSRAMYDNWRRAREAERGMKYAATEKEYKYWKKSLKRQHVSDKAILIFYNWLKKHLNPSAFGGRAELPDLDEIARLGYELYHPEIFGGEGNLEIGEAVHYAPLVDGFLSSKPFGCMPSSGVSDGVQAKIMTMYPDLNFLSIETSGDNEVSILSRVSMMLFKAKQKASKKNSSPHSFYQQKEGA